MGEVTHDQANLMLRVYELRREQRLRQAREWYIGNFFPSTLDEVRKNYPSGTMENASIRMVLSFWDMVAGMVNRGLIDEDFFFESTGEQWVVFERIRGIVEEWRKEHKNPELYAPLEKHAKRLEAWREKRAPGASASQRQRFADIQKARMGKLKAGD